LLVDEYIPAAYQVFLTFCNQTLVSCQWNCNVVISKSSNNM
jgi:hypothetical protein